MSDFYGVETGIIHGTTDYAEEAYAAWLRHLRRERERCWERDIAQADEHTDDLWIIWLRQLKAERVGGEKRT